MNIDHVVLWVADSKRAIDFYTQILGLQPVRVEEFEQKNAPFPSVRLNDETILDLMHVDMLPAALTITGGQAGGQAVNHVCLSMSEKDYTAIRGRLVEQGIEINSGGEKSFGAKGYTSHSEYFQDPDGNIIEIRYYE